MKMLFFMFVCALHVAAFAQSPNWSSGQSTDKTSRWAMTLNDSKGIFNQRCGIDDEECFWSVAITTGCKKDASFPILASTDGGAVHMMVHCGNTFTSGGDTYYQYFFNFDEIDRLVRSSNSIGFAMALQSGQFRVIRFDLTGAVKIIDGMRSSAQSDIDRKPKKRTKDLVL